MGPMTSTSRDPYSPILKTDADVTAMWQKLIDPLGWNDIRVYVNVIDADRRPTPVVLEVDEIPGRFTEGDARALMRIYAHLIHKNAAGGSIAILVCRPGPPQLTDDDRTCCRNLYSAGRAAGIPLELLHVGTDTATVPVPMDEVVSRTA